MPIVTIKAAKYGDVLSKDLIINDVTLFEAGTVLSRQRLEILETLGVTTLSVDSRSTKYKNINEIFANIDKRFSYVEERSFMMVVKSWVKDIVREMGT
ncbi:MAG: hypothetical protein JXB48_07010 [Candidatus Latescibacteria bacterium]|nr:hypothetical protein [Candidatus Latescibacterota bacterium]